MADQAGTVLAIPAELRTVQTTARSSMVTTNDFFECSCKLRNLTYLCLPP